MYTLTAGELTTPATAVITGADIDPVGLLIDTQGNAAYLMSNFIDVTNSGVIERHQIEAGGTFGLDTSIGTLAVTGGLVAESFDGGNLYALSTIALPVPGNSSTGQGGYIDQWTPGPTGLFDGSPVASTAVVSGFPMGMTFVLAH